MGNEDVQDTIKVRMIVKFEIEPAVSIDITPVIGQVDIVPHSGDKLGEDLLRPAMEHFAGSFKPNGDIERLVGDNLRAALGEALQAYRERTGS